MSRLRVKFRLHQTDVDENCLRIFQGRIAISILIFISWGVTNVKCANEQTDALCFARFVPRTQEGVWRYR